MKTMLKITEKIGDGVYEVELGNGAKKCQFAVDIRTRFGGEIAEEVGRFYKDEGKAKWERGYNLIFVTNDELNELEKKAQSKGITSEELKRMEADYVASSNNE